MALVGDHISNGGITLLYYFIILAGLNRLSPESCTVKNIHSDQELADVVTNCRGYLLLVIAKLIKIGNFSWFTFNKAVLHLVNAWCDSTREYVWGS